MLTARGWWCLFAVALALLAGVLLGVPALAVSGLTLLLWFSWEWLSFAVRVRAVVPGLRVEREVGDERGPVATLWAGRTFRVRVRVEVAGPGRLPYVAVADPVPFGVVFVDGVTFLDGELGGGRALELTYRVRCPKAGPARFEGVRVEVADRQGFFYHLAFLRSPAVYSVLPDVLTEDRGQRPRRKEYNQLLPPGIHQLRQPGSSSELLDLRDYVPGDPPRTIAWKVSARRDRLITKEFEGEVPVRCTLFVDVSNSVRLSGGTPERRGGQAGETSEGRPLDRLVELSAAVLRANTRVRDLTGLCLFDEQGATTLRPDRTPRHHGRVLQALADAAGVGPLLARAHPEALTGPAYALAEEVYPELLRREVNAMPGWLAWLVPMPRYPRKRDRGAVAWAHRTKGSLWLAGVVGVPLLFGGVLAALLAGGLAGLPAWLVGPLARVVAGVGFFAVPLGFVAGWLALVVCLLVVLFAGGRLRREARRRKRLSALLSVRYGLAPGGVSALLEDDDSYALLVQRFLNEHQVPFTVPLYDESGRYLAAGPGKVGVLGRALVRAVGRGRDNELFVLLADVLELDAHLDPLLQGVRVALSRHHQVVLVCPWPPGVPAPGAPLPAAGRGGQRLASLMARVTARRFHEAFARLRRTFARMGVPVVCAADEESVAVILDRLERLRAVGGRR
jgi:uncharacterized protein (DUF58 family)